jgi:hypothetical protein
MGRQLQEVGQLHGWGSYMTRYNHRLKIHGADVTCAAFEAEISFSSRCPWFRSQPMDVDG